MAGGEVVGKVPRRFAMAERAQELAERFARAGAEFRAFVEKIPEDQWEKPISAGDPRSVGVVARHVAWAYTFEQRYFQAIAEGHPLSSLSWPEVDALNAEGARQWQSIPTEEVLAALRTAGKEAADWARGLSDEQLERSGEYVAGRPVRTVDQWIERTLIGHIRGHLEDIRGALEE
jgi:hypothetical protein